MPIGKPPVTPVAVPEGRDIPPFGPVDVDIPVAHVPAADILVFDDRGFVNAQEAAGYVYAVTAVDSGGLESQFSQSETPVVTSATQASKSNRIRK